MAGLNIDEKLVHGDALRRDLRETSALSCCARRYLWLKGDGAEHGSLDNRLSAFNLAVSYKPDNTVKTGALSTFKQHPLSVLISTPPPPRAFFPLLLPFLSANIIFHPVIFHPTPLFVFLPPSDGHQCRLDISAPSFIA